MYPAHRMLIIDPAPSAPPVEKLAKKRKPKLSEAPPASGTEEEETSKDTEEKTE